MSDTINLSLWNANGLRATTVHDVLSHCSPTTLLFITETWLLSPACLPTDWEQFHLYGSPVVSSYCGSMGVSDLVSPSFPYPVHQLPSLNKYTFSLKVGPLCFLCLYLPPSLSCSDLISILSSLPIYPNTILCGDFNARLGDITGDSVMSPHGTAMVPWFEEWSLSVLNSSLSYGIATWHGFWQQCTCSSILDLFLCNFDVFPFYAHQY
ncbi:Endonuclease/exonuclease/phosphatase [Spinellus fusiger]|nr:Endonuclease/exonuclease/phosphatase [Spinellus fusiger]